MDTACNDPKMSGSRAGQWLSLPPPQNIQLCPESTELPCPAVTIAPPGAGLGAPSGQSWSASGLPNRPALMLSAVAAWGEPWGILAHVPALQIRLDVGDRRPRETGWDVPDFLAFCQLPLPRSPSTP